MEQVQPFSTAELDAMHEEPLTKRDIAALTRMIRHWDVLSLHVTMSVSRGHTLRKAVLFALKAGVGARV